MTYRPRHVTQFNDPTVPVSVERVQCTYAAGATLLDFETRGAITLWGGQLYVRSGDTDPENGGNLDPDLKRAWAYYHVELDVRTNLPDGTFDGALDWLDLGYAVIFGGQYAEIPASERCQDNANIGHAITVLPERRVVSGVVERLTSDPLCPGFNWMAETILRRYANALGRLHLPVVGGQQRVFYAKTNRAELPDTSTGEEEMLIVGPMRAYAVLRNGARYYAKPGDAQEVGTSGGGPFETLGTDSSRGWVNVIGLKPDLSRNVDPGGEPARWVRRGDLGPYQPLSTGSGTPGSVTVSGLNLTVDGVPI